MVQTQVNMSPTAKIAVNKNLIKVYKDNEVYLKDKQHFQIELYNPTSTPVLAQIKINNKSIGGNGIILRPAERVFLDRFIDTPKKFQFITYLSSGSSEQIEQATKDNGVVEVFFFAEEHIINLSTPIYDWNYQPDFHIGYPCGTSGMISNCGNVTTGSNLTTDAVYSNTSDLTGSVEISAQSNTNPKRNLKRKKVETGRVEQGEQSNQKFEFVNMNFNSYSCSSNTYKLLPISQKNYTTSETHKVRRHCDMCGSRIRKTNSKFCWNCGEKL